MKKMLGFACMLCLMISLAVCAQAGENAIIVNPDPTDRLNLRAEPSEDAVSLGKYYNGVRVYVYSVENGWADVEIQCRRGYVKNEYLEYGTYWGAIWEEKSAVPTMRVNTSSLHLRKDASQKSEIIETYPRGTKVQVIGTGSVWHHVIAPAPDGTNFVGYMMAEYLSDDTDFDDIVIPEGGSVNAVIVNPDPSDRLNLRAEPSEDAVSLGKYYNGVVAFVRGVENGWAEVSIQERTGYVKNEYLVYGEYPGPIWEASSAVPTMTVNTTSLQLREDTSEDRRIIQTYAYGTQVQVIGVGTVWHHVLAPGENGAEYVGYMKADCLAGDVSFHKYEEVDSKYAIIANPNPNDRLNLRAEPSVNAASLGKFYNCVPVKVIEKRSDGWCKVEIGLEGGKASGYMQTQYLDFSSDAEERVTSGIKMYEVTYGTAIEEEAGGADECVLSVEKGDVLCVWGDIGDEYCFVTTRNTTGYFPRWALSEQTI